jgi:hypothetical protein
MWVAFVLLLAADYQGERFHAPAPGDDWALQSPVDDHPDLAAEYDKKDGAIVRISRLDPAPDPAQPSGYLKRVFDELSQPPLSWTVTSHKALTTGGRTAFRVDYVDPEGKRHGVRIAIRTKEGWMIDLDFQAPDEKSFEEDLPAFLGMVDGTATNGKAPKKKPGHT